MLVAPHVADEREELLTTSLVWNIFSVVGDDFKDKI